VIANDWPFQRAADDEILFEIGGRWTDYRLFSSGRKRPARCNSAAGSTPRCRRRSAPRSTTCCRGSTSVCGSGISTYRRKKNRSCFRHALLLRGVAGVSAEQVEDLVELALVECERFYPAFQLVIWGGKTADEAMTAAHPGPGRRGLTFRFKMSNSVLLIGCGRMAAAC